VAIPWLTKLNRAKTLLKVPQAAYFAIAGEKSKKTVAVNLGKRVP
jgi:hypothetical protein